MEHRTHKIMDINENGKHFVCIYNAADKMTPYRLYQLYWASGKYGMTQRRKQLARYSDMKSVLYHVYSAF